jgi:hypothetical protein
MIGPCRLRWPVRSLRLMTPPVAMLAVAGIWLSASALQPDRQRDERLVAHLEVTQHENGVATLTFKFLHLPKTFEISEIILHLEQDKPASPVLGQPLHQVQAAYYTLRIDHNELMERNPTVTAKIHIYRDPSEPYALADICVWYAVPNSRIELIARPIYRDSLGASLDNPTDPARS